MQHLEHFALDDLVGNDISDWPLRAHLMLRIDFAGHPAEHIDWTIEPSTLPWRARVGRAAYGEKAAAPLQTIRFGGAPGSSWRERAFALVALATFGEASMPPRIVGAPIWCQVSAALICAGGAREGCEVELLASAPGLARLRVRQTPQGAWCQRHDTLDRRDADPIRALLSRAIGVDSGGLVFEAQPMPITRAATVVAPVEPLIETSPGFVGAWA